MNVVISLVTVGNAWKHVIMLEKTLPAEVQSMNYTGELCIYIVLCETSLLI